VDIQAIIDGIVDAGRLEIESVEKKANQQVRAIREKAKAEANQQKDRILKDSRVRINRTQAVIDQRADMQALRMHANARQKLIMIVLERSQANLKKMREKSNYKFVLAKLVSDAVHAVIPSLLHDQRIILHVSQKDKKTIQSMEIPYQERMNIQYDLQSNGGCEVESDDGLVKVLNTFESRFDRALPKIQQDLSVFFEEKITSG